LVHHGVALINGSVNGGQAAPPHHESISSLGITMHHSPSRDGRFAPSPSGPMHLGNLRTALLAWCAARSAGARFLVRIDDLDRGRSRLEHEAGQLADLRRLGLDWDGEPLRQSARAERYREALERLRVRGALYPCWCSRRELREAASAPHTTALGGEAPYPGTCRRLSARERAARERGGRPAAWRLDGGGERVSFTDLVHGELRSAVDDFVVWRGGPHTGTAAYQLAVVVDDADQAVGEVVRGDDLLTSTPRQVLLARHLGIPVPRYAHVPLVLGADGARLAKRHGAVTLADQLEAGLTVPEVLGWMASSAGLAEPGERLGAEEVAERFDYGLLRREATVLGAQVIEAGVR
jgi:glutamyl-tRNA synthetase